MPTLAYSKFLNTPAYSSGFSNFQLIYVHFYTSTLNLVFNLKITKVKHVHERK